MASSCLYLTQWATEPSEDALGRRFRGVGVTSSSESSVCCDSPRRRPILRPVSSFSESLSKRRRFVAKNKKNWSVDYILLHEEKLGVNMRLPMRSLRGRILKPLRGCNEDGPGCEALVDDVMNDR